MKERTFKNPAVVHRMVYMRLQGWPLKELAIVFDCQHSSIKRQCEKSGIPRILPLLPRPEIQFKRVFLNESNERVNQGKKYRDYLKDFKEKHPIESVRYFIL